MDSTVKQICETYSGEREKLGSYYVLIANQTLKMLCQTFGQEWV